MTACVFDTSAIFNIVNRTLGESISILREGFTSYLVFYEIGNLIWKEVNIFKTIEKEEGVKTLSAYRSLISIMKVKELETEDSELVLQIAVDLSISYYDAAFVSLCTNSGMRLITDDFKLAKIVDDHQEYFKSRFNRPLKVSSSQHVLENA